MAGNWTVRLVARRSADVMLVTSSSANMYRIYHSSLGAPTCVKTQFSVPAGGWVQIAWVPQPGATAVDDDANTLMDITASRGRVTVPLAAVSRVTETRTPHTPSGAVVTFRDIGDALPRQHVV